MEGVFWVLQYPSLLLTRIIPGGSYLTMHNVAMMTLPSSEEGGERSACPNAKSITGRLFVSCASDVQIFFGIAPVHRTLMKNLKGIEFIRPTEATLGFVSLLTISFLFIFCSISASCKQGRNYTSLKLGVQFLGLGYYHPSTEKIRQVYPVWCNHYSSKSYT